MWDAEARRFRGRAGVGFDAGMGGCMDWFMHLMHGFARAMFVKQAADPKAAGQHFRPSMVGANCHKSMHGICSWRSSKFKRKAENDYVSPLASTAASPSTFHLVLHVPVLTSMICRR